MALPSNAEEWRDLLERRLAERWARIRVYDAYYEGDQVLAYATQKFREAYGALFTELTDNWMQIVVDAPVERLWVQGVRFGDQEADDEAWAIWQANGLDAEANMVHTESVKLCEAYWIVQPMGSGATPRITSEHPSQVIVASAPGDRRQRLAALKKWQEGDEVRANVYLPDRVVKYRAKRDPTLFQNPDPKAKWETIEAQRNPLGVVPVIPVPNNPSMLRGGRSELAGGPTGLQDAVNKLLADMLVGSEYTAYPQRVLLGIDQPRDANGQPIPMEQLDKTAAKSRLWMFPGKDGRAFEFSAANLKNFMESIQGLVDHLAAQTRTPPHYVVGKMANMSGDALKAAETGLVAKVKDKQASFGEAHEEMFRLAFRAMDASDPRAIDTNAEIIWRDPESRTMGEVVDAAMKKAAIGVPWEQLMEDIGYSPQQIERMQAMRTADALLGSLNAEEPTEPAPDEQV